MVNFSTENSSLLKFRWFTFKVWFTKEKLVIDKNIFFATLYFVSSLDLQSHPISRFSK
jgi:hypothetical protein